jgi:hypothetical protein
MATRREFIQKTALSAAGITSGAKIKTAPNTLEGIQ